jgi:hypothetical protein
VFAGKYIKISSITAIFIRVEKGQERNKKLLFVG